MNTANHEITAFWLQTPGKPSDLLAKGCLSKVEWTSKKPGSAKLALQALKTTPPWHSDLAQWLGEGMEGLALLSHQTLTLQYMEWRCAMDFNTQAQQPHVKSNMAITTNSPTDASMPWHCCGSWDSAVGLWCLLLLCHWPLGAPACATWPNAKLNTDVFNKLIFP